MKSLGSTPAIRPLRPTFSQEEMAQALRKRLEENKFLPQQDKRQMLALLNMMFPLVHAPGLGRAYGVQQS